MTDIARTIIWRNSAIIYLEKALDYIREDSPQNAQKIALKINAALLKAAINPEHCTIDKFKKDNNRSFRVLFIYHYRISFFYDESQILIVRVRHSKQKPLNF